MIPVRYVGDVASAFTLDALPGLDLTGATAVIQFRKPDGAVLTKTATVNAGNRTLSYTWIAGDLDLGGIWIAWGRATIGAGIIYAHPVAFVVGAAP